MLDARAQRIRESLEHAEQAERAAQQAEADRQALLSETRREAEQIRARADEQAKRIIDEAAARAREQADRIIEQGRANSAQERQQMLADVHAHLADLVVTAVDRVTRGALDAQTQRTLVQQFLTTAEPGSANGSAGTRR